MEKIDKYLHNKMNEQERRAFEKELKSKPELAAEMSFLKEAYLYLQHQKRREALKDNLQQAAHQYRQKRGNIFQLNRKSVLSIAAALALLLTTVFLLKNLQTDNTMPSYAELAQHSPLALTQMGAAEEDITAAEQAFNSKNYAAAAETLQRYLEAHPEDQLAQLYLAISLIETGQTEKARELLKPLNQSPDFRDKALWYTALSFFKENQPEKAKPWLQKISPTAKEYDKAQKLLSIE